VLLAAAGLLPVACGPHGPTTPAFDGTYQGIGYAADPALAGVACANNIPLSTMTVSGGHVEFGNFRGWVQPNGQLQTVFGQVYLYGQFQGTHFTGLIQNPQPGCNYRLDMNRTS
jgi:hypothetical protein